jgi:hypothetical protein
VSLVVSERRTTGSPATRGSSLWQENAIVWHKKPRAFEELTLILVSTQITPMSFTKTSATIVLSLGLFAAADPAKCALLVHNGDFQDLTGLTAQPGASGWYQGVPAGWSSSTANLNYNVINYSSGNIGANLQTLGPSAPSFTPLHQSVGLLPSTGDVTLSFNILGFSATYGMAAAIYDASSGTGPGNGWTLLISGSYDQTVPTIQTLVASNVAASTTIGIGFWQWAGAPGIDNVSVTAIPEPSTYFALLMLGATGLMARVAHRNRRQ